MNVGEEEREGGSEGGRAGGREGASVGSEEGKKEVARGENEEAMAGM